MEYKSLSDSLGESANQLGNNIRSLPHVVIGNKSKDHTPIPSKGLFNDKEQDIINKITKYGLIIAVVIIILYAIVRIFL
jgi:hypothetical protein